MKLSVKVDYACRVLAQLGKLYGTDELGHIEQLARVEEVPANYLVQILSELRNGGLIISKRGKQGGYALAKPPEEISLLDILTLIEGDVLEMAGNGQGASGPRVTEAWRQVRESLVKSCQRVTLDRLCADSGEQMYYI